MNGLVWVLIVNILSCACGEILDTRWNRQVISVSDCGELTTAGATYVLQGDITNFLPINAYCFKISSPSITLDGNGYSITQYLDELDLDCACVLVSSQNVVVQNIQLQCNTGVVITDAGAVVRNAQVYSGDEGISVLGDFATILDCTLAAIEGADATGIAVGAVRGVTISQATVNGCAATKNYVGGGGGAVGISLSGSRDARLINNQLLNITGGDGLAITADDAGGSAVGILLQNVQNVTVYGNLINQVTGGGVLLSSTPLFGGVGGSAFGIQLVESSASVTFNTISQIVGIEGGQGSAFNGGDGGQAAGITADTLYISDISNNNIQEITAGDGGDAKAFAGGVGGDASGVLVTTQGDCVSAVQNNIGAITAGDGGSSTLSFLFPKVNGKANIQKLPSSLPCQITGLTIDAPASVHEREVVEISFNTSIYGFSVNNYAQQCHFETNDTTAQMPADQEILTSEFNFSTKFSSPGFLNGEEQYTVFVRITCNGTSEEVYIVVEQGGPNKPLPVTFSRFGRGYVVVNWQLENVTNDEECHLFYSSNFTSTAWANVVINASLSRYP